MRILFSLLAIGLLAAGCAGTGGVNTTSSQEYRATTVQRGYEASTDLDRAVQNQKEIAPLLVLPARFGIARIQNGRLTQIPQAEAEIWSARFREYGSMDYGTVEPVNLTIADTAVRESGNEAFAKDPIARIRLGAAAQKLDAVFIYEVSGTSRTSENALSVADLTIIGAYIAPSRKVEATGQVNSVLMDVRNGYPYISQSTAIDRQALSAWVGSRAKRRDVLDRAIVDAVEQMSREMVPLMEQLKDQLNARAAQG